jgi:hypothetical protein
MYFKLYIFDRREDMDFELNVSKHFPDLIYS